MKTIQYNIPQYPEIEGKSEEIIRQFGGLNSFDPLSIPSNNFTELVNMNFDDFPTLKTRDFYRALAGLDGEIIGLGVWKGIELHFISSTGQWTKYNGTSFTTVTTGMNTSANYYFANFQGNQSDICLFVCNGASGLYRYNGTSATGVGNAPADINHITTYQNRLWGSSGNQLHASALDEPLEWQKFTGNQDDSYFKTIESDRGENISFLSGGLSKLIIGLPNSIRELYGGIPQDFSDRLITEDVGVASGLAGVTHDGVLYAAHETGIYSYSGGTLPNKSYYEIIKNFNFDLSQIKSSYSFQDYLLFSIDDCLLVFDNRDMCKSWTIWRGKEINSMAEFKNELYLASADGFVYKLSKENPFLEEISFSIITKVFNSYSIAHKQRLYKLYLTVELEGELDVSLSSSVKDNDFELVHTITSTNPASRRVIVPLGKYARENFIRIKLSGTGTFKLYEINRQYRTLPTR